MFWLRHLALVRVLSFLTSEARSRAVWHKAHKSLWTALASGRALGMEVTIFNPCLDSNGEIARALVDSVVRALTT
jgi:hypothetical protein